MQWIYYLQDDDKKILFAFHIMGVRAIVKRYRLNKAFGSVSYLIDEYGYSIEEARKGYLSLLKCGCKKRGET